MPLTISSNSTPPPIGGLHQPGLKGRSNSGYSSPVDSHALGRTGISISEFIFGAGAIGGIGSSPTTRGHGLTPDEGYARLDEAYALGITAIDTADAYGGGESERTVGRWLAESQPAGTLVCTKVGSIVRADGTGGVDLSPAHIERQLAQSTGRLGRVDLYLSHVPDPGTPVQQTLEAFTQARATGKIRAYGVCNVSAALLDEILATADRAGLDRPGWVQNCLSLLARQDEQDVLPLAAAEGLGYTPFSPLAGGVLSDRYLDGAPATPGSRIAVAGDRYYPGMHTQANLDRVAALRVVARRHMVSVSGLALAWLRSHPLVTAPIVSPSKAAQWQAVREALTLDLAEDERAEISAIFS
jgi:1-deoxyxylulose-5-phosphate synthase